MSIFNSIEIGTSGHSIAVTKFWNGQTYNEAVSAWIDFDQDGIFQADEKILESGSSNTPTVSNNNFSVPIDAKTGDTVMRVLMKYYGNPGGQIQNDPCETYQYGEVEDYTVSFFEDVLSIDDQTLESITVFPNPFKDILDIKIPSNINSTNLSIEIYDVLGRRINIDQTTINGNTIRLNTLTAIQSGTYILRINDLENNNSIVRQLIKQ